MLSSKGSTDNNLTITTKKKNPCSTNETIFFPVAIIAGCLLNGPRGSLVDHMRVVIALVLSVEIMHILSFT